MEEHAEESKFQNVPWIKKSVDKKKQWKNKSLTSRFLIPSLRLMEYAKLQEFDSSLPADTRKCVK